jgi:hypothetical protein
VLAHWNGTAWGTKPLPKISSSPPGAGVLDVVASSDADIWVVGSTVSSTGAFVSLALHWVGGVWHQLDPAGNLPLGQVIADGAGGVWAAGSPSYGNSAVFHYSAGKWTSVPMPTVSGKFTSISALARVPGTTTVYGAGMPVFGGLPETEGLIVHD